MKISLMVSALLVIGATTAFAQQPAVYPLRSQSGATQGVDSAYCYWQAKRQTGVNMARQSQRPERTKPIQFGADAGRGASEPPLPTARGVPSTASRTRNAAIAASGAVSASAASGVPPQAARPDAASANVNSVRMPPSASSPSGSASVSGLASLPPLPPPPPPMTTYWQAYGDCMQARGYGVQ